MCVRIIQYVLASLGGGNILVSQGQKHGGSKSDDGIVEEVFRERELENGGEEVCTIIKIKIGVLNNAKGLVKIFF